MFRYIVFCAFFFVLLFLSFTMFVWKWRTELVATMIERSFSSYKATVEQVELTAKNTLKISEIHLRNSEGTEILHLSEALLTTPPSSWISWFLIPSTQPLSLRSVELRVKKGSLHSFTPSRSPFFITIETLIIIQSDGTKKIFPNISTQPDQLSFLSLLKKTC